MQHNLDETASTRQSIMLDRLCAAVRAFYENPKNIQAYEAWLSSKEDKNGSIHKDNTQPGDTQKA